MKTLWPLGISLFFAACHPDTPTNNGAGLYYWKTRYELNEESLGELRENGVKQLFIRCFDVDYDFNKGAARPRGQLSFPANTKLPQDLQLIPVVYIVERVFRQDIDPVELAERVSRTVRGIATDHPELLASNRWQVDCDWTPTSRQRYFAFLEALQSLEPTIDLSVTVRLHQYRERERNGIPPVPSGLLMCYNMEAVDNLNSPNAIYREDLLRGYLKAPPYPLTLDVALPVFSWGAAFRERLFLGIVDSPADLSSVLRPVGKGKFLVQRDTSSRGTFLRAGDLVRYDGPGAVADQERAAALLRARPEVRDLLLFDWQPGFSVRDSLYQVYDTFYR